MFTVIFIRLLASSVILRFPLFGALFVILIDYFDIRLLHFLQNGNLSNYQSLDKMLDLSYLSVEAWVALHWKNRLARNIAIGLFLYRLIGAIAFEITQQESLLLLFPNIFEYFFLAYLIFMKFVPDEKINKSKTDPFTHVRAILTILALITIPKLYQEYLLHVWQPWTGNKPNVVLQAIVDPDFSAIANSINLPKP